MCLGGTSVSESSSFSWVDSRRKAFSSGDDFCSLGERFEVFFVLILKLHDRVLFRELDVKLGAELDWCDWLDMIWQRKGHG